MLETHKGCPSTCRRTDVTWVSASVHVETRLGLSAVRATTAVEPPGWKRYVNPGGAVECVVKMCVLEWSRHSWTQTAAQRKSAQAAAMMQSR
jgi:hypothetical protein